MRVLADQIASRALTQHSERSTTPTETMDPNPNVVVDAMWHRSALNSNDTRSFFSRPRTMEPSGPTVSLDEVMLHTNRILHNADGYEREHYLKETIIEDAGSSSERRDSLGSPSDMEGGPNMLDTVMLHQNRILHNEDGYVREDYMKERSQTLRELLVDQEGSTIFS